MKKNNKNKVNKNYKTGRRNRRTGFRNPMSFQLSGRTSPLGPQFTHALITQYVSGSLSEKSNVPLVNILYSQEFIRRMDLWDYFKVQKICISVSPNNLNTSSKPCYMYLNWGNGSSFHIRLKDNVKIIPAYRTRFYTYCYNVPEVEDEGFLLNKYHPTEDVSLFPGKLELYAPGNTDSWDIRVDFYVKFKGSRTGQDLTKGLRLEDFIVKEEQNNLKVEEAKSSFNIKLENQESYVNTNINQQDSSLSASNTEQDI